VGSLESHLIVPPQKEAALFEFCEAAKTVRTIALPFARHGPVLARFSSTVLPRTFVLRSLPKSNQCPQPGSGPGYGFEWRPGHRQSARRENEGCVYVSVAWKLSCSTASEFCAPR